MTFLRPLVLAVGLGIAGSLAHAQGIIQPDTKSIKVSVRGIPEAERNRINGDYPVLPAGDINLPLIGKVKVPGWGYASLSLAIQTRYRAANIYPDIEVHAWQAGGQAEALPCIDISGESDIKQLSLPLGRDITTLSEALKKVRPKNSADLARIKIQRKDRVEIIDATKPEGLAYQLAANDLVAIPAKK